MIDLGIKLYKEGKIVKEFGSTLYNKDAKLWTVGKEVAYFTDDDGIKCVGLDLDMNTRFYDLYVITKVTNDNVVIAEFMRRVLP